MATSILVSPRPASPRPSLFTLVARRQGGWFFGLLLFVAGVSVHDAALLVFNQELIAEYEQNPIGAWLIHVNAGSVWLFVGVKLLGTSLVVAILASLYEQTEKLGLMVTSTLALLQLSLLLYLYFA